MKKFPSFSQWKQIFKVLNKSERISLLTFFALAAGSFVFLATDIYINNTNVVPSSGGSYTEGIVGQPRFINPIYDETNDVDRTITGLVFSGLMTYDGQGQIVKDLAENYTVSPDGKTYDFQLKNNVFWHDGKSLSADDVVYTIKTIQNSDYKSPLRANWVDVNVEKISDKGVRFTLKNAYNSFLENLTVKIIPQHIWQNIPAENFALSPYNLQPIGSGPFQFSSIEQNAQGLITTLNLQSNRRYFNHPAYISGLSFKFFEKNEDLVQAAKSGQIDGLTLASLDNNELEAEKEINQGLWQNNKFNVFNFSLPRYFAVFFNLSSASGQKSPIFSDDNVRKAMTYAVNKNEIAEKISKETKNNVTIVDSPILPDFYGYKKPSATYGFDIEKAKSLLDKAGFTDNGSGLREKAINKKPAFQFKSYLKVGSRGQEVVQLQSCLEKLDDSFKSLLQNEVNGKYGKGTEDATTAFQKKYLPSEKPTGETGKATRAQLNKLCQPPQQNSLPLKFTLVTIDQPQLVEVANMLKEYWRNVGADVDVKAYSIGDLKPIIKSRSYDALLYGEALGAEPDLYPFWHSSQKTDPGLNLSSYENKNANALLQDARATMDESLKQQKYEQLQDIIISDAPALFLYNPNYIYWVSSKVMGVDTKKIIDPSKRFVNAPDWYIKTKRVWKKS